MRLTRFLLVASLFGCANSQTAPALNNRATGETDRPTVQRSSAERSIVEATDHSQSHQRTTAQEGNALAAEFREAGQDLVEDLVREVVGDVAQSVLPRQLSVKSKSKAVKTRPVYASKLTAKRPKVVSKKPLLASPIIVGPVLPVFPIIRDRPIVKTKKYKAPKHGEAPPRKCSASPSQIGGCGRVLAAKKPVGVISKAPVVSTAKAPVVWHNAPAAPKVTTKKAANASPKVMKTARPVVTKVPVETVPSKSKVPVAQNKVKSRKPIVAKKSPKKAPVVVQEKVSTPKCGKDCSKKGSLLRAVPQRSYNKNAFLAPAYVAPRKIALNSGKRRKPKAPVAAKGKAPTGKEVVVEKAPSKAACNGKACHV